MVNLSEHFKGYAFDEAHALMHEKSKRTKAAQSVVRDATDDQLVMMLTGTPVLNRPIELVPMLLMLGVLSEKPGAKNSVRWFKSRFCWDAETSTYNGSQREEELAEYLRMACMIRRTKDQVLTELPAKQRSPQWIELDSDSKRLYKALAAEGYAAAQKTNAATIVYLNSLRKAVGEAKIAQALGFIRDFLSSTGRKLVVFADHIDVQHRIVESLERDGIRVATLLGGQSDKAKEAAKAEFQDGDARVIVCSIKAAGTGHTLTAASDVLTVEVRWNPGEHTQAEDRVHRMGQTSDSVTAWYLLADDTIDQWSWDLVEDKRRITDTIHDGVDATDPEVTGTRYLMKMIGESL